MNIIFSWIIVGVLLGLSEFVFPSFVICFFGISAIIVGGILCIVPLSAAWQLLIFAAMGVVLLLTCRRFIPNVFKGELARKITDIDGDDVAGKECRCVEAITPDREGKVEFRGSLWSAKASEDIVPGTICFVIARENVILLVTKIRETK